MGSEGEKEIILMKLGKLTDGIVIRNIDESFLLVLDPQYSRDCCHCGLENSGKN